MFYSAIKKNDVANGPGVRVNLFVSGCTHRCKDCFNESTWNFTNGKLFTSKELLEIVEAMAPSYITGFTFLGGEPMEPENRREVLMIARVLKERYPQKDIWIYTGYLAEELLSLAGLWDSALVPSADEIPRNRVLQDYSPAEDAAELAELLKLTDILVDGEFVAEKKNLRLKFRGSENQRIIHMPTTIASGDIIRAPIVDRD